MKITQLMCAVALSTVAQAASAAITPTVDLTGLGYVTYGDANSYSLAVGNYYTCGSEMGKDCPYSVKGSPGADSTDPRVYIVQGAGGHMNNDSSIIDDAFEAVNNDLFFTMTSGNEPGSNGSSGTFTGDQTGTWDATLSALKDMFELAKNNLTFFFVNNEPNSQDGLTQNLAVWARVTLSKLGQVIGTWDATNDARTAAQRTANSPSDPGYGPPPIGGGVVLGDVTLYTSESNPPEVTDFIMSGGQVCIDRLTKDIVNCATAASGTFDTINHNLGENQAPYAVLFPELNALIRQLISDGKDLTQYVLNVDLRYGCVVPPYSIETAGKDSCVDWGTAVSQDNNFEQVFIGATPTHETPEPGVVALVGLGLLGIAASRRRRNGAQT